MVQSETRYCQKFWRKREKPFFFQVSKKCTFLPKNCSSLNQWWVPVLVLVVSYGLDKESKSDLSFKMLLADFASVVRELSQKSRWKGDILASAVLKGGARWSMAANLTIAIPHMHSENALFES